jgi:methyl-accepting chemotaxis protein
MTIDKKIMCGFGAILGIFLVIGFLCYRSTAKLIDNSQWVTHTYEVLENVEFVLSRMKDVESLHLAYLMTGEETYKIQFRNARQEVERTKAELRKQTSDNDRQQRKLAELDSAVDHLLMYYQKTIDTLKAQTKDAAAALASINAYERQKLLAAFQSIIKDMQNEEHRLLKERTTDTEASASLTIYTILVGNTLAVAVVAVGGYFLVRSITIPVRQAVSQLSAAGAELLASTTQQAAGSQEQAAAVTQTVTTVDEVSQTAEQAAQRAKSVGEAVQRNLEIGKAGRKAIEDSITAKHRVKEQIEATAESILGLAEQAQAIGEVIATVNDIAEQINLLALNAAIEASRAGEHGRGFSVVAGEVKALADQSKKATVQIRQSLGEIQKATNTTVLSTEEVTRGVATAIQLGTQAGETITSLTQALSETAQVAAQIVASAGQQATGMTQIRQAMRNIDQIAQQNAAATRQATQAAANLNVLGTQLTQLISK